MKIYYAYILIIIFFKYIIYFISNIIFLMLYNNKHKNKFK